MIKAAKKAIIATIAILANKINALYSIYVLQNT